MRGYFYINLFFKYKDYLQTVQPFHHVWLGPDVATAPLNVTFSKNAFCNFESVKAPFAWNDKLLFKPNEPNVEEILPTPNLSMFVADETAPGPLFAYGVKSGLL